MKSSSWGFMWLKTFFFLSFMKVAVKEETGEGWIWKLNLAFTHRSKWKSQGENKPSSPAQQLPPTPQLPAPFLACFAKGRPYPGPVCSEWHACDRRKDLGKYWHRFLCQLPILRHMRPAQGSTVTGKNDWEVPKITCWIPQYQQNS